MKTGKSLTELAREIERQAAAKADYAAPAASLELRTNGHSELRVGELGPFEVQPLAHRQLSSYLNIPAQHYDYLRHHTETLQVLVEGRGPVPLFDVTLNTLLHGRPDDERRLVRTLDDRARALLSDRYRPIDNDEIAERILPILAEFPGIDWAGASMELTETRLYIKVVNTRVQADVKVGDTVQAGVMVSNSEVGHGSFAITPLIFRLVCQNGMVRQDFARRKFHTGGILGRDSEDEVWQYLRDDTIRTRNEATVLEMRDLVREALSEALFGRLVDGLRQAAGIPITGDPARSVDIVTRQFGLTQDERGGVLRALIEGADLSLWGLANAVTATAQTQPSYDRSVELEAVGGQLLALPEAKLREVVEAS